MSIFLKLIFYLVLANNDQFRIVWCKNNDQAFLYGTSLDTTAGPWRTIVLWEDSKNCRYFTVGFWCQTIHRKFLRRFDTIFGLKMMVKNILKFHDSLQSCCCPVQKNLPRKAELAWQVSRYL